MRTEMLQRAFDMASRLPVEDQEALAVQWIEDLESEARWDEAFARTPDALAKMAARALREDEAGLTLPVDPGRD